MHYDCVCRILSGWRFVMDPDCPVHIATYGAAWPLEDRVP